jgi:hypothetical protein
VGGLKIIFTVEIKARFVSRVKGPDRTQRLSKTQLFNLAHDLAENMYISRKIKNESKSAGMHFYYQFMSRHQRVCL